MCKWGTTTDVRLYAAGWNGTGKPRANGTYLIPIDSCIAPIVKALNDGGVLTRNSCCGHGKGPGKIDLVDGRTLVVETTA
jgi:hypothetical protein